MKITDTQGREWKLVYPDWNPHNKNVPSFTPSDATVRELAAILGDHRTTILTREGIARALLAAIAGKAT